MREESPYYRFGAKNECVANVYGLKWKALDGTNGETRVPEAGTIDALFHVQGRASRWPDVFPGDDPAIKFFSLVIAEKLAASELTGIELHPVHLRLGNLRSLKNKADQCPGYMWARVTGVLLVDLWMWGRQWPLDPSGMFLAEKPKYNNIERMRIRPVQPLAADFSRVAPGGTGYIAISNRAAKFFDQLNLPEVIIGARGNGAL